MSRTVHCRKYQQDLDGLDTPPLPGAKGEDIFNNISRKAWQEWQHLQTMLINEKSLNLREPTARKYLSEQMVRFFNNEPTDHAEGYVTPSND